MRTVEQIKADQRRISVILRQERALGMLANPDHIAHFTRELVGLGDELRLARRRRLSIIEPKFHEHLKPVLDAAVAAYSDDIGGPGEEDFGADYWRSRVWESFEEGVLEMLANYDDFDLDLPGEYNEPELRSEAAVEAAERRAEGMEWERGCR